jgi:chloramphenicol-sensitive protein RarD
MYTNEQKKGVFYAVIAFLFWGLVPIYFKQVSNVAPFEVLIHRVIFSVFVLLIMLTIAKQFNLIKPILKTPNSLKYLFISAILVSTNWLIFIYAISENKILEASLGYYINPLISMFFGYIFFKEKLNNNQKFAILIAFIAVLIQLYTIGKLPLISIGLALSFALYAVVRKKVNIASLPGLFIETLLLFPFALFYLIYLLITQSSAIITSDSYTIFMLSLAGIVTVLPLLWFNSATIRLQISTIGMLQYIGPSVAFAVAILIYNEPINSAKLITFALIWFALGLFSYDSFKNIKTNTQ